MINLFKKTLFFMNTSTRRQGLLVLGLMVLGAFLEAAGVGLVFPLVKVISEPDVILNSPITTFLFRRTLGATSLHRTTAPAPLGEKGKPRSG